MNNGLHRIDAIVGFGDDRLEVTIVHLLRRDLPLWQARPHNVPTRLDDVAVDDIDACDAESPLTRQEEGCVADPATCV